MAEQPHILIKADKAISKSDNDSSRTVLNVCRSGVQVGQFSEDLLTLIEFRVFEFQYCASNTSWAENLRSILDRISIEESLVLFNPDGFTLIPENLYRNEDHDRYFELNGLKLQDMTITRSELPDGKGILLSLLPNEIWRHLQTFDLKPDLYPHLTGRLTNGPTMRLILREENIDIIVQDPEVRMLNRFSADHSNDILYFCVSCCEQCGNEPSEQTVIVSGDSHRTVEIKTLLSKYFKTVISPDTPKKVKTPYGFKDLDASAYFPILNSYLCV